MKRYFGLLILMLACYVAPARAWNCSNPLDSRVDVGTTKPSTGTAGDGDGQYFLGTGTEGTKGHYYICETPKTSTPKNGTKQKQQQNQNQQQSQTANGGASTLTNSGNSTSNSSASNSLANSGNSSNKNTNNNALTANGGTANSNSSATNNGNGSNNASYQSTTTIDAARIPVNTAYAPTTVPTMSCFKTYSGGAQTVPFGVSVGGGKVDDNCRKLETAMHATNQLVYCKIYITTKDAKAAGVTMEDCLGPKPEAPVAVVVPLPPTPVVVPVPEPTPAPPVVKASEEQYSLLGTCTLAHSNGCKRILDGAIQSHATALRVVGPSEASFVAQYLRERHSSIRLEQRLSDDQNSTVSVYLLYPSEQIVFGQ